MDKLYDKYYYKLYYWAIKKTNNKEDAEDLVNNIFVAIFEYFNKNINIENIDNLIWKVAYNSWCTKAKKYIKEKNNTNYDEQIITSYDDNTLDKIIYNEIMDNLDNINLTDKEKISFRLYYGDDLSIKEISEIIDSSINNVKYYLYSARNKVKEKYNG